MSDNPPAAHLLDEALARMRWRVERERFALVGFPEPPAPEDGLLGRWEGTLGSLWLGADSRYSFSPPDGQSDEPATLAGHAGAWQLDDDVLVLEPDAPNLEPLRLRPETRSNALVLTSPHGELRRSED